MRETAIKISGFDEILLMKIKYYKLKLLIIQKCKIENRLK